MKTSLFRKTILTLIIIMSLPAIAQQKVTKILAIGNSFSRDAVEQYLWDLADAGKEKCIIGNLYIGGCPIDRHVENARNNNPAYEYRKIGIDGIRVQTDNKKLDDALQEEKWDIVTVQQASYDSGNYNSFALLPELISYIRARVPYNTKILFHQTWAYAQTSNHSGFKKYGNSQIRMYRAICECSEKAARDNNLNGIIPAGTAIQIARSTELGDNLNADGYHLDHLVGRYIAACTWYEYIFKHKVKGNRFAPKGMTKKQKRLSQKSAHAACRKAIHNLTLT